MWLVGKRRVVSAEVPYNEIIYEIPSDPITEGSELEFKQFVKSYFLFPVKFEWETELSNNKYEITERIYFPLRWYLLFSMSFMLSVTAILMIRVSGSNLISLVSFGGLLVGLSCHVLSILFLFVVKSPAASLLNEREADVTTIPIASIEALIIPVLLLTGLGSVLLGLFSITAASGLLLSYVLYHQKLVNGSRAVQEKVVGLGKMLPLIAANYVFQLILSSIIVGTYVYSFSNMGSTSILSYFPVAVVFSFTVLCVYAVFYFSLARTWSSQKSRFDSTGQVRQLPSYSLAFVIIPSLLFAYLVYRFLSVVVTVLYSGFPISVLVVTVVVGLPVWYFIIGAFYQAFSFSSTASKLKANSRQKNLDHVLETDADTYVVENDGWYAGALWPPDIIVVSEDLIKELPREELACVIAHEEAHLNYGDAKVGLYLSFLSILSFTGKNAAYALFDFRGREFRADEYAVSRIEDREKMIETLDTLQEFKSLGQFESILDATPTLVSFGSAEDSSIASKLFGFYYGAFALSGAHASLSQRKENLRNSREAEC